MCRRQHAVTQSQLQPTGYIQNRKTLVEGGIKSDPNVWLSETLDLSSTRS